MNIPCCISFSGQCLLLAVILIGAFGYSISGCGYAEKTSNRKIFTVGKEQIECAQLDTALDYVISCSLLRPNSESIEIGRTDKCRFSDLKFEITGQPGKKIIYFYSPDIEHCFLPDQSSLKEHGLEVIAKYK